MNDEIERKRIKEIVTKNRTGATKNILSSMASKPINIRWLRTGSWPTEKSCIASNYRQFSTNIKLEIIKLIPFFLARAFGPARLTKLVLIL